MENVLIYEGPVDDINRPAKIVLPINETFEDVPSRIAKALKLLSAIEDCTVHDIEETVMSLGSDFFRQRIITSSNISTIPLAMANKVISTLSALVSYSACLEEEVQPFFAKGRSIGKKILEKCRFGQTFIGSFGLALEMPMTPALSENSAQIPFERRVMTRIAQGMLTIRQAVQEADVEILVKDYKLGFNANLYETMMDLVSSIQDHQMEFSFAWSPEYDVPEKLKTTRNIRFSSESALPFLESAAKTLRRSSESQDTTIVGRIVQLRDDNKISGEDLDDPGASDNGYRMIVIEWETEKGKPALIRASLSSEEYKVACDAHRDGKFISLRGKPEKSGKYFILTQPTDFKVSVNIR